jgi:RNA polymerase sigma factor (sigma-70 family)
MRRPADPEPTESEPHGTAQTEEQLYRLHVGAARRQARQLSRCPADLDDLVSEAFERVFRAHREGHTPIVAFRAYLLTTLRHIAYDKTLRDRKVTLTDDVTIAGGVRPGQLVEPFRDTALAALDCSLAARAFVGLPDRWQAILSATVIDGRSPADVAPTFGMTPNSVAALAWRAREGLRNAYLRAHLVDTPNEQCRGVHAQLGAWTRDSLTPGRYARVQEHLDQCQDCHRQAQELSDINAEQLRAA